MNTFEIFSNKTTSSYPIAIGTGLALESISIGPNDVYDNTREIPNQVNLNNYDLIYINISTILRNLLGSINTALIPTLNVNETTDILANEIDTIITILKDNIKGDTNLLIYYNEYKNLNSIFPNANIRNTFTDKSLFLKDLSSKIIINYITKYSGVKIYDNLIKGDRNRSCLILTHYVLDLLAYNEFRQLDLLESHTGKLKDRFQFYTKLLSNKDLIKIPFNKFSMQVFGDKETFSPFPISVKKEVLRLAEDFKWTQLTTLDRISFCLTTIKDNNLSNILLKLL